MKPSNVEKNHRSALTPAQTIIFGRPFVKRFAICYRTVVCPVGNVGVLWPNGWMDQDETWHADRPQPFPQCVRWGPSVLQLSPAPIGHSPQFSAHIWYVPKRLDASWCHLVCIIAPLVVSTCVVFKISTFGCVLHVTWIHCRSLDCGRFYIVVILRSRGSRRDQQQQQLLLYWYLSISYTVLFWI